MESLFVGIDLAIAKSKLLPIYFCHWQEGRLIPLPVTKINIRPPKGRGNRAVLEQSAVEDFSIQAAEYISKIAASLGAPVARIGIDAPRRPRDESCRRRESEKAMDAAGISCFTTPSHREFEHLPVLGEN